MTSAAPGSTHARRSLGAVRKPLGALQMKIVSDTSSRRNKHTILAVLEVNKEIPANWEQIH